VPLTVTQIPAHIHTFQANSALGTANLISAGAAIASLNASAQLNPAPNVFAPPAGSNPSLIPLNPGTVSGGGSSAGHPNVQPSLTLNFCIATAGTYPPRN
jgi:microcystin-dependent protein